MSTAIVEKLISVEHVRTALYSVVAQGPLEVDPVRPPYAPPQYMNGNDPACLIARILLRLGFPPATLRALDHEYPQGEILRSGVLVCESQHPALRKFDENALCLLTYLQRLSDAGHTWGSIAVDAFRPARFTLPRFDRQKRPWLYG